MKLILKILAALVVLILVAVLLLVLFFDLNVLKPRIESMAREQGVDLHIGGDIGWTFWPSVGVAVSDIKVAPVSTPDDVIATLNKASLLVELMPLFKGDVVVHHVLVDGANIALAVDKQGKGNWEKLLEAESTQAAPAGSSAPSADAPSTSTEPATAESSDLRLSVERISLSNSALKYQDAKSGQLIALDDINLDIKQFNLQNQPFDMTLDLKTRIENPQDKSVQPMAIAVSLANRLQIDAGLTKAVLSGGELKLVINNDGKLNARYNLTATDLQGDLRFEGDLTVPAFDAKALLGALGTPLQTREKYALSAISFETRIAGNANSVNAEPLTLQVDKTRFTGSFAITDLSRTAIKAVLKGDRIIADDYLAPETETTAPAKASTGGSTAGGGSPATASAVASADDEELIPLDLLKTLNADASFDMDSVTFAGIPLEAIRVRVKAANGQLNLTQADANVYQGTLAATANVDARGNTAITRFDAKVANVQIEPAMKALDLGDNFTISGGINANATANTRGVTFHQIMDALVAEATFAGAQVRFAPLNIEQKFCEIIDLVNKADAVDRGSWDNFTEIRELSGRITMAKRLISVEAVKAGVHQLEVGTHGTIDLANDKYDLMLPLKLLSEETSEKGCRVSGGFWLNRSLSLLRCHGSLETLNPVSDCRQDSKGLTSLTKDFAEYKIREKHGEKIEQKKDELLEKLDKKLGGDGEGDSAKNLLKGLLRGKKSSSADESATGE